MGERRQKNMINVIRDWLRNRTRKEGKNPDFIPISREEMDIVMRSEQFVYEKPRNDMNNAIFGTDAFMTPFAEPMRKRQVELLELCKAVEAADPRFIHEEYIAQDLHRQLRAFVCTDTTNIEVTFDFDPWQRWKQRLRLTRWLPIKRKTIKIDGRVLYPYLNIRLPHNRHHVQFVCR